MVVRPPPAGARSARRRPCRSAACPAGATGTVTLDLGRHAAVRHHPARRLVPAARRPGRRHLPGDRHLLRGRRTTRLERRHHLRRRTARRSPAFAATGEPGQPRSYGNAGHAVLQRSRRRRPPDGDLHRRRARRCAWRCCRPPRASGGRPGRRDLPGHRDVPRRPGQHAPATATTTFEVAKAPVVLDRRRVTDPSLPYGNAADADLRRRPGRRAGHRDVHRRRCGALHGHPAGDLLRRAGGRRGR